MKRHLFLGLALAGAFAHSAENYESLIFNLSDGTSIIVPAEGLNMVVKDDALQATSSEGTHLIPLSTLKSFRFSGELSEATLTPAEGCRDFEAYTLGGISLGQFSSPAELPAGTYIVKTEGRIFKLAVK